MKKYKRQYINFESLKIRKYRNSMYLFIYFFQKCKFASTVLVSTDFTFYERVLVYLDFY